MISSHREPSTVVVFQSRIDAVATAQALRFAVERLTELMDRTAEHAEAVGTHEAINGAGVKIADAILYRELLHDLANKIEPKGGA